MFTFVYIKLVLLLIKLFIILLLSSDITLAPSLATFKRRLKKEILEG